MAGTRVAESLGLVNSDWTLSAIDNGTHSGYDELHVPRTENRADIEQELKLKLKLKQKLKQKLNLLNKK
ncbi:hypothetical protein ACLKA6_003375 [Drosophila palustris]